MGGDEERRHVLTSSGCGNLEGDTSEAESAGHSRDQSEMDLDRGETHLGSSSGL